MSKRRSIISLVKFSKFLILRPNSTKMDRLWEFLEMLKPRPTRIRLCYFDNVKIIVIELLEVDSKNRLENKKVNLSGNTMISKFRTKLWDPHGQGSLINLFSSLSIILFSFLLV